MLFVIWMGDRSMVRKSLLLLSSFQGISQDAEVHQGDAPEHLQEDDQGHLLAGLHQDADLEDDLDLLLEEDHHPLGAVRHQGEGLPPQDVAAGQDQDVGQGLLQQGGGEETLPVADQGVQLAVAEIPPPQALIVPVKSFAFFFILILIN